MGSSSSKIKLNQQQEYKLNKQLKNNIYSISINDESKGFGFLCFIKNSETRILITSTRTLNEKDITKKINLELKRKDNKKYNINLDIKRAYYLNEYKDLIMLEIKKEDNFEDDNFFEVDNNINDPSKYLKKEVYLLPYKLENNKFPVGKIIKINNNDDSIEHNCDDIEKENLFGPLLLLDNFKIIGFNQSKTKAIFLKKYLDEYIEKKRELFLKEQLNKKEKDDPRKKVETNIKREESNIKREEQNIKRKEQNIKIEEQNKIIEEPNKIIEEPNKIIEQPNKIREKPNNNNKGNNKIFIYLDVKKEDKAEEVYFFDKKNLGGDGGFVKEIGKYKDKIKLNIILPNEVRKKDSFINKFKPESKDYNQNGNCIYIVEVEFPKPIINCGYMFYDCNNIIEVDLSNFDTSNITNMNDMFSYCINVRKIKFPSNANKSNIIEKVTNMNYMFNYCKNLEEIDLSIFKTENVTSMGGMFQNCEKLEKINLENFNTKNVVQLGCMFNDCYNLKEITFSQDFTISKALFIPWMFYGCESLKKLDLRYFNFRNVMDRSKIFGGCDQLKVVDVNRDDFVIFNSLSKENNNITFNKI